MKRSITQGFTLIEVLVVIAIIGVLASITYVNFHDSRVLAQNKIMRSELKSTQLALEVYKAQFGGYPANLNALKPDFMSEPATAAKSSNPGCVIDYAPGAGNSYYKLTAVNCFGGATDATDGIQPSDKMARCPSSCGTCAGATFDDSYRATADFYESFAVFSAGGECQ